VRVIAAAGDQQGCQQQDEERAHSRIVRRSRAFG
jgi:hypothetical protein